MALGYAAPLVEGDSTTLAIPMSGYAASLSTGNDNADPRVTWVDNAGGVVNFFNSSTANLGELAMDDSLYADATMRRYDFIITRDGSSLVFSGSFDGSPFSTTVAAGPPNLIPDFQFNTVGLAYAYSPGESVSYDNVAVKVSRSGAFTYPPVQLDALYASGCVLQRDRLVTVRGSAQPGETLTLNVAAQLKNAVVDPEGNWSIVLDPEPAGGPYFLQVEGTLSQATRLNDVYFGDVWVLCGQSNMEQSVFTQSTNYPTYYPPFPDAADDFDDIRFLLLRPVQGLDGPAGKPLLDKPWTRWAQAELAEMSAAGYFFARELKARLVENGQGDVPLGFIKACKGGTAAEQWVSADALALMPEALIPRADKPASTYYNGMIAPIQGYSVKGVLWYQGEANADTIGRIEQYPLLFNTLVQSWRAQWNHPEMPFYFVQLAPFQAYLDEPRDRLWAWMRGAQAECRSIGNTGMACIIDSGLQGDIHPPFKDRVGRRLARLALAGSYGIAMIDKGPTVSRVETSAGEAVITFDNVAGGLQTLAVDAQPDSEEIAEGKLPVSVGADELAGFALCGSDRIFYRATKAEIIGPHQVRVSNLLDVPEPVAVRYAWESFPRCNLFNSEGLPAEPFRGDAYAFNTAAGAPSTPPGLAYALWQEEHFSPEELGTPDLESSVWGYDADPDGDGLGNLLEYAFGLDPRASDGSLQPISIVVESGQLKVRYLVSRKAKADPYLDLRLETTSELSRQSGWSVLDEPYILHTDNVFSEIREVALPSLNVANPARFIRVHALRAAP
jgi:sialate O-acetylesterase